jgi:inositol-phosphate phosphatase / L-galactose 1-phosphate phosphatase / histidinol-phosphatase
MSDPDDALTLAVRLADAARPIAVRYFRSGLAIDRKADTTPVTEADREVERQLRAMIEDAFPDHGILGEEHGAVRLDARSVWVIDPIDGTKGFVTGKPLFGTLIAMLRDGAPLVGVIEVPALGERWVGTEGRPTTFNGRAVTVRACADLRDAWVYSSTPYMFQGADAVAFDRLRAETREPVFGADCYAYGLLANGTIDLVCEAMMHPYDYCALVPVVEGAGGVITDWQGAPLGLRSDGRVLAAGDARAHAAALALLAG